MNQDNFSKLYERYLIPANIRLVILSVGWEQHANTILSDIPYYIWVDDFLSTADRYGIDIFFYFGSWKKSIDIPSWWDDVDKARPELRSFFMNGTIIGIRDPNPLACDSPLIVDQLKEDLMQLYEYYGKHKSWLGIAFGRPGFSFTYIPLERALADWGFHNSSFMGFINSDYYLRDVDSKGLHSDGTKCVLWQAFKETRPLLQLSSGYWQRSSPIDIYGKKIVAIHFKAREKLRGFKISWYGRRIGTPGNMIFALYNSTDISSYSYIEPLETVIMPANKIGESRYWQPFIEFKSTLEDGRTYSLILMSEAGNNSNKYEVYYRIWRMDDSSFFLTETGISGRWQFQGGGILWIKDIENNDKLIYPYQDMGILRNEGSNLDAFFTAPIDIVCNTIFIFVSDRPYDETPAIIKIIRVSDKEVIARGILRPDYARGMYFWMPIPLESEITLDEGKEYIIRLERMSKGIGWQWHFLITDPPTVGFQGQARALLFKLAYIDPIFVNFMRISPGPLGPETHTPGAEYTHWWAQRYQITKTAPLLRVEINIQKYGNPGDLIVRLREDNGTGKAPEDRDIETISISSDAIPTARTWLNVTGWNTVLQAGKLYWIIFSTKEASSGNGYWLWKTEYAYEFLIEKSSNAGKTWSRPHEPSEMFIKLVTALEVFRVEPEEAYNFHITDKKLIAQSFFLGNDTTIYGVLVYFNRANVDRDGLLTVEIRTDNSFDSPSSMVLTSATISLIENGISFTGLQYIDFNYPCSLMKGQKYWLVLKTDAESVIVPYCFFYHDPELSYGGTIYKVKISENGGSSWDLPKNKKSDLIFGLVRSPFEPYPFTTEELARDIEMYHVHDLYDDPIRGWNLYLNIQTSKNLKDVIYWFESYTGRRWFSIDPNPPKIIQEVQGERQLISLLEANDLLSNESISSFQEKIIMDFLEYPKVTIMPSLTLTSRTLDFVKAYYYTTIPITPKHVTLFNINSISTLNYTINTTLSDIWDLSKRMVYVDEYFGKSKRDLNILFIGNQSSAMLARYLMSIVNITFINYSQDYNFTKFSNFRSFHAIVWASDRESMNLITLNAQERIIDFIKKGGGLIMLNPWSKWADEVVGFSITSRKMGFDSVSYIEYNHSILKPYKNLSSYANQSWENEVIPLDSNLTYIIKSVNNQPWLSTNLYGLGRSVLYAAPESIYSGDGNGYITLLINAIFYVAQKEKTLPILWLGDFNGQTTPNTVQYSLKGKPGGPILLWLTNNGPTITSNIHLNASFFHLNTKGWLALDITSLQPVELGQGDDIYISFDVTNTSWIPIYIFNDTRDSYMLYSNSNIKSQKVYPNQAIYTIESSHLITTWLIIRSTKKVQEVMLGNQSMQRVYSLSEVKLPTFYEGWFHDSKNELLYIKIVIEGSQNVRTIFESPEPFLLFLEKYPYIPYIIAILTVLIIELLVVIRKK